MKRFHVHVAVENLAASVRFYTDLFGAAPTVERPDYAKWMLDDPRVNFAISARGHKPGINHLGFQAEDAAELAELGARATDASGAAVLKETGAECCYAKSDKYWVLDPQGLPWEHFYTLGEVPIFGEDSATMEANAEEKCCIPLFQGKGSGDDASSAACCVPTTRQQGSSCC
jgi:catechol 2,3-dioxygenase-like lactoylglutathione lyase family enzyme